MPLHRAVFGFQHDTGGVTEVFTRASLRTPAASNCSGVTTPFSALRSVLRRWPKAARTTSAKRRRSMMPTVSGSRGTSRTTAESTFGGGRNAPGGTTNSEVT